MSWSRIANYFPESIPYLFSPPSCHPLICDHASGLDWVHGRCTRLDCRLFHSLEPWDTLQFCKVWTTCPRRSNTYHLMLNSTKIFQFVWKFPNSRTHAKFVWSIHIASELISPGWFFFAVISRSIVTPTFVLIATHRVFSPQDHLAGEQTSVSPRFFLHHFCVIIFSFVPSKLFYWLCIYSSDFDFSTFLSNFQDHIPLSKSVLTFLFSLLHAYFISKWV